MQRVGWSVKKDIREERGLMKYKTSTCTLPTGAECECVRGRAGIGQTAKFQKVLTSKSCRKLIMLIVSSFAKDGALVALFLPRLHHALKSQLVMIAFYG